MNLLFSQGLHSASSKEAVTNTLHCENKCIIEIIKLPLISWRALEGNLGKCSSMVGLDFHTFTLTRNIPTGFWDRKFPHY